MHKFRRFAQLSGADQRLLLTAAFELLRGRIRLSVVSTRDIVNALRGQKSAPLDAERDRTINVERISWAIAAAARHVPWRSDCLIQVMAADQWLTRHGLQGEFYLGVAKLDNGQLAAHAWLKWHGMTVTGGECPQFRTLIAPE